MNDSTSGGITGGVVLVIANLVDLSAIASVGSATVLALFLFSGIAGYRLRTETSSNADGRTPNRTSNSA